MTTSLALELIDKAYAEKATFLDLGNCGLTAIPEEITKLAPFLKELNLGSYYYRVDEYIHSENKGAGNDFSLIDANFSIFHKLHLTGLFLSQTFIGTSHIKDIVQFLPDITSLDVSSNQLTEVDAQYIAQFKRLNYLQISYNRLTDSGAYHVAKIETLTSLQIIRNHLTVKSAKYIVQLKALINLQISENQLTDAGVQYIAQFEKLTYLGVSWTQLTDVGALYMTQLKTLTTLDISWNQLTDKGADHLAQLIDLREIDISSNQLTEKGIGRLLTLVRLTSLNIKGNKDLETVPQSIRYDLNALRDYFQAGRLVDNNFVKVILIGNTTAGKSSLADYLINEKFDSERESTHGIQLWKWSLENEDGSDGLTVNIWDFGGQDYYHATHTLFLSDKTLFLFLHTDEKTHTEVSRETGQYLSVGYWLGNIKSLARNDTIIWFVQSKYEPEIIGSELREYRKMGRPLSPRLFLEPDLAKGVIRNQFTLSVKRAYAKDPEAIFNFNFFRKSLITELRMLAKQQLPESWIEIRDNHLPTWRNRTLYLDINDFWEQCKTAVNHKHVYRNDFSTFPVGLLTYLNGCGEIVWFQHNPVLSSHIYLSVDQLTKKLFDILSLKIKDNQGVFTLSSQADSDREEIEEYLKILTEFKLIFKAAGTADTYIIPQYLPENPYTTHFQQLIQVAYVIRFTHYMPRSLVTRFLVQYGNTEGSYYWRYGAFFKRNNFHLFVQMNVNTQTVTVHISDGPSREKYAILQELFRFFTLPATTDEERLKGSSIRIEPSKRPDEVALSDEDKSIIQLSSDGVEFATIAELERAIQSKLSKVKSSEGNYMTVSPVMHQLLNPGATTPKKIFLSYAHKDEPYKKELDTHFSALKRSGLVETWQDREIMAGEDWDKVIKDAIRQSDIVLLMLSPDFMASDYIWNTELPAAKAHNTEIIPLFIRPCDFEETQFSIYQQQGLPRDEAGKMRWVVSSIFPNRDEGYLSIVEGVKSLLKKNA